MFELQETDALLDQYRYCITCGNKNYSYSPSEILKLLQTSIQSEHLEWSISDHNRYISSKYDKDLIVHREVTLSARHISQQYIRLQENRNVIRLTMVFDRPRVYKEFVIGINENQNYTVEVISYIEEAYKDQLGQYIDIMRQSHRQVDELFLHWLSQKLV